MSVEVTLIGNEGFRIVTEAMRIYVDAFSGWLPGVTVRRGDEDAEADLILVTHGHWDHFDAGRVAQAAARSGARVAGPASVIRRLRKKVAGEALVELEPEHAGREGKAAAQKATIGEATVTAFRTFHGSDHNSYLVETAGFRFFHDGDNEDTRGIDAAALGKVDALFIGPWQGSDWVAFIEALSPTRWFLMHLSDAELDQHEAGKFLPELCDHVPAGLVTLRPGQTCVLE